VLYTRIDQTLADSFPASDPPSWTPAIAHPNSAIGLQPQTRPTQADADAGARTGASGLTSGGRTFTQRLVSFAGAVGIALLVPFAILLVGLPVVLAVRGVLELFGWLFGLNIR